MADQTLRKKIEESSKRWIGRSIGKAAEILKTCDIGSLKAGGWMWLVGARSIGSLQSVIWSVRVPASSFGPIENPNNTRN